MAQQQIETQFVMTAQDRAGAVLTSLKGRLEGVKSAAGGVQGAFAALAGSAAFAALAARVQTSADLGDQLAKLSQRTGLAVETLSVLRYQAQLSGASFEDLQTGLVKFNVRVAQAAAGNQEFLGVFQALGISQADLKAGLSDTEGLLRRVSDRFAGYADGANKSAIAVKLFEEGGTKLIPLLNGGSAGLDRARTQLDRFGGVLSGDFAKRAEAFNDNLSRLRTLSEAGAISLGEKLIPQINEIIRAFIKGREEGEGFAGALGRALKVGTIGTELQESDRAIIALQERYTQAQDELAQAQARYVRGQQRLRETGLDQGRFGAERLASLEQPLNRARAQLYLLEGQRAVLEQARRRLEIEQKKTDDLARPATTGGGAQPQAPALPQSGGGADEGKAFIESLQKRLVTIEQNEFAALRFEAAQKKVAAAAEPIIVQLEREITFREELKRRMEADAQARDAEIDRRAGVVNGVAEYVKGLEQETSLLKLSNEERLVETQLLKLEEAGLSRASAEFQAAAARIRGAVNANAGTKLFEETRTPIEQLNRELGRLQKLLDEGAIDWDTYARAVLNAEDRFNAAGRELEKTKSLSEELGPVLSSSFEDAAFSGGKLRDVVTGLGEDIAKLLFRRNITRPVADAIGGFDFLGAIKGLFGFATGGIMSSGGPLPLRKYASGGIANSPQLALFGEGRRPEAYVPLPDGRTIPVSLRGGGAGVAVSVKVDNHAGDVVRADARARDDGMGGVTIDVIVDRIESAQIRRMRQGGGLAPAIEGLYGLTRAAGAYR